MFRILVVAIATTLSSLQVLAEDGAWQDLITLQALPAEITLQPNIPVLAQGAARATPQS